jgi:hypothetical protein
MTFIIMEIWDMRWRRFYMQIQFSKYFSFKKTIFVLLEYTPNIQILQQRLRLCQQYILDRNDGISTKKGADRKNSYSQLTVKKCNEAKNKYKLSSYSLDCFLICHLGKESEISFLQNYSKRYALYWLIVVDSLSF